MGMEFKSEGTDFEYFRHVVSADNGNHQCERRCKEGCVCSWKVRRGSGPSIRKRFPMIISFMSGHASGRHSLPGSEQIFLKIMRDDLGKDVLEDPRHTTCTGIGYHGDVVPFETIQTVVATAFCTCHGGRVQEHRNLMCHLLRHLYRDT